MSSKTCLDYCLEAVELLPGLFVVWCLVLLLLLLASCFVPAWSSFVVKDFFDLGGGWPSGGLLRSPLIPPLFS